MCIDKQNNSIQILLLDWIDRDNKEVVMFKNRGDKIENEIEITIRNELFYCYSYAYFISISQV